MLRSKLIFCLIIVISILTFEDDGVAHQLVNADYLVHGKAVVGQHLGKLALTNGADCRHVCDTVILDDIVQCCGSG